MGKEHILTNIHEYSTISRKTNIHESEHILQKWLIPKVSGIMARMGKEHILRNIMDFSPRGVGHKVLDMLEYRKNGKRTHSDEYSRIFYNLPQNESEYIHTNIGPRGLGHKVVDMSGHIRVQEDEHNLPQNEKEHIWTNILDFSPCIVGQSGQNT